MVSDIAAVHGRSGSLTPESLVYCLFKHGSAAILRDLVVRAGDRYLVRGASVQALQRILSMVGVQVTQGSLGRVLSRWVPLVGALGMGAYAYYDTYHVGKTAIDLFSKEVVLQARDEARRSA